MGYPMRRELQEAAFTREVEKRIDQLATEFNLTYPFVIGSLELILHGIKMEYFKEDVED